MKTLIALALLSGAAAHAAPAPENQTFPAMNASGVIVAAKGAVFAFVPQKAAPAPCQAEHAGLVAMSSTYQLCTCNGSAWITTANGESCAW